jgi:hypothetical protein
MSGSSSKKDDPKLQSQNLELRKAISDAYAAVEGYKSVQTFSAITFEDLADQQIERISGKDTQSRPNELNRVQRVLENLKQAVTQIKNMPPDAFEDSDKDRDVNTPP